MAHDVISVCPVCQGELMISRLHCRSCGTALEGEFGVGRFGRLSREQLSLLESFLRSRGNLKEMERELGISYPTVRSRVDALVRALGLGEGDEPVLEPEASEDAEPEPRAGRRSERCAASGHPRAPRPARAERDRRGRAAARAGRRMTWPTFSRTQAFGHHLGSDGRRDVINVTDADLHVEGVDGEEVQVQATFDIRATTDAEADAIFEAAQLRVTRGSRSLQVEQPDEHRGFRGLRHELETAVSRIFGGNGVEVTDPGRGSPRGGSARACR